VAEKNKDNIIIRDFKLEDSIFLEDMFKSDLERFFSYLTKDQKKLFIEVNSAKRFIELSQRPTDLVKIIEKDKKIIGYFHFGKNTEKADSLKIQRIHITTPQQGIFKNYVWPTIMQYAKLWNCKEIVVYITYHLKPIIHKLFPGFKFYGPIVKYRRGVNMLFYKYVKGI